MINTIRHYIFRLEAAVLLVPVLIILLWPGLIPNFFQSTFMPHGHCYLWEPSLLWLHFFSDLFIGLAYLAISFGIGFLVYKARRDIPFHGMFIAFGLFIVTCGFTHLMEVYTIWASTYWISGTIKMITAVASVATAIAIPIFVPRALNLIKEAKYSEERKRKIEAANQELELLYDKLKRLDESKTAFFTNVSHELRTPLTLIMGSGSRLINETAIPDNYKSEIQVINKNASTMLNYVNDLLDVSKLEFGKLRPNFSSTDVSELLKFSVSHFESIIDQNNINLTVVSPPALIADVDPEKINRIFLNLISNSIKFTPRNGEIKITLNKKNELLEWQIMDSGPGIEDESKESIFERFSSSDQLYNSRFKGTGLGLTITKEFVELHNGTIDVGDSIFGGALFKITLPLKQSVIKEEYTSENLQASSNLVKTTAELLENELQNIKEQETAKGKIIKSKRSGEHTPLVLIIEDNYDLNKYITKSLINDYDVIQEYNGKDGLEAVLNYSPDLIITDLMMPVMGGEEFINELRNNGDMDNIPVILLTAKADDNLRIKLLTRGAQDYMIKPFSIEELSARMKNLITLKIAKEQLQKDLHSKTENINTLIEEITGRKKEIEVSLSEKETMLKEIHHRVKNNLQIITSLLSLQTNKMNDIDCIDILNESKNRIKAMSLIHEKLYHSEFLSRVNFGIYLQDLVDSIVSSYDVDISRIKFTVKYDEIITTLDTAIPVALIVNELVTNAIKYAFVDLQEGQISIYLHHTGPEKAELIIQDNGKGLPEDFKFDNSTSLGLLLVKNLSDQIGAELKYSTVKGTEFIFRFKYQESDL